MNYLKQKRAQLILTCFLISSLALVTFSDVDIHISRVFFDKTFYMSKHAWTIVLHHSVAYFIALSMVSILAIYAFNRFLSRNVGGIDGRKLSYVALVLIVGAGLIVNMIFKDNFGRARPRDIEEFGGAKQFTPAFVISNQCDRNCSFSSGDGAGAFFSIALAMSLSRKRRVFLAGLGIGTLVSLARIASGAHFFSDTIVSFFVMLIVADVFYYYMMLPIPATPKPATTLLPDGPVAPANILS